MARYNEILVGRFARGVQKLFGIKGEVPVGSLAGELSIIHNLFSGAENRYLEGWERFGTNAFAAAVAANGSGIRLRNPTANNAMVVIERLAIGQVVAGKNLLLQIGPSTTDLASLQIPAPLDTRGRSLPSSVFSFQNSVAGVIATLGSTLDSPTLPANTYINWIQTENQEIPLLPGTALQLITGAVNEDAYLSLVWRERFLEEAERT